MRKSKRAKVSIPQVIIFQLLKELPAKSLLRFRCVCKLWRSIIDDPFFITTHRNRSHTRPGGTTILVLDYRGGTGNFYSLKPKGGKAVQLQSLPCMCFPTVFNSVNGLVCLGDLIWNPTTRETLTLRPTPVTCDLVGPHTFWDFYRVSLLGFAPSTNEYKVLNMCRIRMTKDPDRPGSHELTRVECKVWTLGTDLWRNISIDSLLQEKLSSVDFDVTSECYVNGTLYCLVAESGIVAFDVGNEIFRCISLPDGASRPWLCNVIQVRESIAFIDGKVEYLWILDGSGHWNMEEIVIPDQYKPSDWYIGSHWPTTTLFGTICTGEILLLSQSQDSVKLFYYNLETKNLKKIRSRGIPRGYRTLFTKHVECLFKLKARMS